MLDSHALPADESARAEVLMSRDRGETVKVAVTLTAARRLNNSVNGNPRYDVLLSDGRVHQTSSDASASYDVLNYVNSHALADVTLTRAGKITVIRDHKITLGE